MRIGCIGLVNIASWEVLGRQHGCSSSSARRMHSGSTRLSYKVRIAGRYAETVHRFTQGTRGRRRRRLDSRSAQRRAAKRVLIVDGHSHQDHSADSHEQRCEGACTAAARRAANGRGFRNCRPRRLVQLFHGLVVVGRVELTRLSCRPRAPIWRHLGRRGDDKRHLCVGLDVCH